MSYYPGNSNYTNDGNSSLMNSRDGFLSKNFIGHRKDAQVSPTPVGPNSITYGQWKTDRGYK